MWALVRDLTVRQSDLHPYPRATPSQRATAKVLARAASRTVPSFQVAASRADRRFRQVLAARTGQLGEEHPHIANSVNHAGLAIDKDGRHEEAESWFRRALAGQ